MIFKICGLKEKTSLLCCATNKVDFFGMIFYEKSPRNINLDEAKKIYNNILKSHPKFVEVYNNLGLIFRSEGENEKAIKCYQKAIKINPLAFFLSLVFNPGLMNFQIS